MDRWKCKDQLKSSLLSINQADLRYVCMAREREERRRTKKGTEKGPGVMEEDRYWHPRALAMSASVLQSCKNDNRVLSVGPSIPLVPE